MRRVLTILVTVYLINIHLLFATSVSVPVIFLSGLVPSRSHHEVSVQNTIKGHLNA